MPIPFPLGTCGDKELGLLEAWATKTLGIKYPDGPRKEIIERISFEPFEEDVRQLEGPAQAPRSERHDGK